MLEILTAAVVVLLLDQGSKRAIQARRQQVAMGWGSVVRIRCVENRNPMYRRERVRAVLAGTWLLAVLSAATLYWTGLRFQSSLGLVGLGAALAGSASNLVDILRDRYIVDFIDLGWWPVFNLADVAIVAGLAIAIVL